MPNAKNISLRESTGEKVNSGSERAMKVLAETTPWVLSLMFHLGMFLVLIFIVFCTVPEQVEATVVIPDAVYVDSPQPMFTPKSNVNKPQQNRPARESRSSRSTRTPIITTDQPDQSLTKTALNIDTLDRAESDVSLLAKDRGLKMAGSKFYVSGGNARNIVYVLDGSGSMEVSGALRAVRQEMYRSIGGLCEKQAFGIIMYTDGRPVECGRGLMVADRENKVKAADFLAGYTGQGQSNPIPAIERAFAYLKNTKNPGKLIYLLSDGEFKSASGEVTNAKLLAKLRALNADGDVHIMTILIGSKKPEAVKVMQDIASQNKGRFKAVSWGE